MCREAAIAEARLEQLLSEKLMKGYVLMESSCPKCSTPLVKNHQMVPKTLSTPSFTDENDDGAPTTTKINKCVLLPAASFDQPFRPVDGVPMCVSCQTHVITQETEVCILEQCDSMKDKGSIYVAINGGGKKKKTTTDGNDGPEIINLIHVQDDIEEVTVVEDNGNNHRGHQQQRKQFLVDIQTTSFDDDGNSAFELTFSPRAAATEEPGIQMIAEGDEGDEAKPIVIQDPATEPIFVEDPANPEIPKADTEPSVDEKEAYSAR